MLAIASGVRIRRVGPVVVGAVLGLTVGVFSLFGSLILGFPMPRALPAVISVESLLVISGPVATLAEVLSRLHLQQRWERIVKR